MSKRYTLREIRALLWAAEFPAGLKATETGGVVDEFDHLVAATFDSNAHARAQFLAAAPAIVRQLLRKGTAKAKGKVRT